MNKVNNLLFGVLRLKSGPTWNAQLLLFIIGGCIELLLITALIKESATVAFAKSSVMPWLVSVTCAAVAVLHQFLIFRNLEVQREADLEKEILGSHCPSCPKCQTPIVPPAPPEKLSLFTRFFKFWLTVTTVFLLAAITGEVPYLISLLLFSSDGGPAAAHLDYLGIFSGTANWAQASPVKFRNDFTLFCKYLFFGFSAMLSLVLIFWDCFERNMGNLKDGYSTKISVPIWIVFLVSDALALLIWIFLLFVLYYYWQFLLSSNDPSSIMNCLYCLGVVAFVYFLLIGSRIGVGMVSPQTPEQIRKRIV